MEGFSADLEQKLNNLKPKGDMVAPDLESPSAQSEVEEKIDQGLFDIKLLNDIEDVVVRAALKKVYMGAKKASKSSVEVIPEMIAELESKDKLNDEIKSLLEGILK